jgi:hypothetical protein
MTIHMIIIKTRSNYDYEYNYTTNVFILNQYLNLKYYNQIPFSLKWTNQCLNYFILFTYIDIF